MKTLKKLAAILLAAGMVVGCSSNSESTTTENEESAKYAKIGLGFSIESSDERTDSTIAVVGLDAEGKITYCDLDVAQLYKDSDDTRTKVEKAEDYGMKGTSGIGKEWYEQAEFFANYVMENALTVDEVLELTNDEGTDVAVGCTVHISGFQEAIEKAVANAKDCECDSISKGVNCVIEEDQTDVTVVAVGSTDGKIVAASLDVAQIGFGSDDVRTKVEKAADYGMSGVSSIGKEWYEQAAAFEDYIVGMTAADVAAIETYEKNESHPAVPAEGTDLASGCTINIGTFQEVVAEALA